MTVPVINLLSPHVADLIAAGEVVERPGSAVKELIENSIDAGARSITVEIRGGGMTYIRVTDDGCGMSPEDAGAAFLRHATSKLSNETGLEAIGTLGFRGEALAAISAVSRVELLTRRRGDKSGTRVVLEAGDISLMENTGCPEGTAITIRDLFFNTPARLKFMKTDRAEGAFCRDTALRCALGAPGVSIRCIRDDNEEFFSPGDGRADSCVYSLLGRETAANMLACSSDDGTVSVSGFVSSPRSLRGNRAGQFFFCNGRYIKSRTLQSALEQAYKNSLLTGRFPSCVLYLSVNFSAVDVNVHPAKTEVKFSDERRVFDCVYYAALGALESESSTAEINLSRGTKTVTEPKPDFYRQMSSAEFRSVQSEARQSGAGIQNTQPRIRQAQSFESSQKLERERRPVPVAAAPVAAAPDAAQTAQTHIQQEYIAGIKSGDGDFRLIGEAMSTYIIVERGSELILIDKHAAHERIIFDELKSGRRPAMPQMLIAPVTFSPGDETAEILLGSLDLLESLGFELEAYGDSAVVLRAMPSDTDESDGAAMLEEIAEKLRLGQGAEDTRDSVLYTVACRAAIKAGDSSNALEALTLAGRVLSGEVKYCPHGRPVSVSISKAQLDKQFARQI